MMSQTFVALEGVRDYPLSPSHMPRCPAPRAPDTPGGWAQSLWEFPAVAPNLQVLPTWEGPGASLKRTTTQRTILGAQASCVDPGQLGADMVRRELEGQDWSRHLRCQTRSALLPALARTTLFRGRAGYSWMRSELKSSLRHSALWNTLVPNRETMPTSSTLWTTKSPWGWVLRANRICGKGHCVPVDTRGVSTTPQASADRRPGWICLLSRAQGHQFGYSGETGLLRVYQFWHTRHRASHNHWDGEQGCTTYRCLCLSAAGGCWQHWGPREWPTVCGQCQSGSQTPLLSPCCLVLDEGKMFATL